MAILTGHLKPRERLIESELIKRFNLKRFNVRKAIQELAYLGFVDFVPNKGASVVDISDEELEDLYKVRMTLENLACELLIQKIDSDKLNLLKAIHKKYIKAVADDSSEKMIILNEEFHKTLYEMTGNRFLKDHLERLLNSIFALRYSAYLMLGIFKNSIDQHGAILQALEERDLNKLKKYTRKNIIQPKMIYESRRVKRDKLGTKS